MSKADELKKEAEEYLINHGYGDEERMSEWIDIYIAGAEPREKRIEELEEVRTAQANLLNKDIIRITNLEKENAELKERLELLNLNANIAVRDLNDLLTKAIGIITRWYETNRSACIEPSQELIEVTEQFIKEIEK